jgi:type VI secretion system secreted protein Hcp
MVAEIFIKFPNDIKGETSQAGHVDEVPVNSVQWGVNRQVELSAGSRQTGRATFSDVVITKEFDSASNDLAKACFTAAALDEIVITFRKDAGDESLDYLSYTLSDCLISSYSVSSGGSGRPMESMTIAYIKLKSTYKKQANDHSAASEHEFEVDLRGRS